MDPCSEKRLEAILPTHHPRPELDMEPSVKSASRRSSQGHPMCAMCERRCRPTFPLPCHVLCRLCMGLLVNYRARAEVIQCPECYRLYPMTQQWHEHYGPNAPLRNDKSAMYEDKRCDRCRKGHITPPLLAEYFCYQCQICLCRECHVATHSLSPKKLSHIVIPFVPIDWVVLRQAGACSCSVHESQYFFLFCVTCHALLCPLCKAQEDEDQEGGKHDGHEMRNLLITLANARNALLQRLQTMQDQHRVLSYSLDYFSLMYRTVLHSPSAGQSLDAGIGEHLTGSVDPSSIEEIHNDHPSLSRPGCKRQNPMNPSGLWNAQASNEAVAGPSMGSPRDPGPRSKKKKIAEHPQTARHSTDGSADSDDHEDYQEASFGVESECSGGDIQESHTVGYEVIHGDTNMTASSYQLRPVSTFSPSPVDTNVPSHPSALMNEVSLEESMSGDSPQSVNLEDPLPLSPLSPLSPIPEDQNNSETYELNQKNMRVMAEEAQQCFLHAETSADGESQARATPFSRGEYMALDSCEQAETVQNMSDNPTANVSASLTDGCSELLHDERGQPFHEKGEFEQEDKKRLKDILDKHFWSLRAANDVLMSRIERLWYQLYYADERGLCSTRTWMSARPVMSLEVYNVLNRLLSDCVPGFADTSDAPCMSPASELSISEDLDYHSSDTCRSWSLSPSPNPSPRPNPSPNQRPNPSREYSPVPSIMALAAADAESRGDNREVPAGASQLNNVRQDFDLERNVDRAIKALYARRGSSMNQ